MKNLTKTMLQPARAISTAFCLAALPLVLSVTGCAGDRYHESTGESIDDSAITMRVKSALGSDNEYKYDDVSVKTFKGTVQLSGFVNNSAQKGHAAEIARGVDGVKDVDNNINVKE